MKERINLEKVALIGRTFEEYENIFRLMDFKSKNVSILDVGSGVSSFCAEASKRGMKVLAMDPIYTYKSIELVEKCKKDLELIIKELNGVEHLYIWEIFRNKDDLRKQNVLDSLKSRTDYRSPLSLLVGSKGYHAQNFKNRPYPV